METLSLFVSFLLFLPFLLSMMGVNSPYDNSWSVGSSLLSCLSHLSIFFSSRWMAWISWFRLFLDACFASDWTWSYCLTTFQILALNVLTYWAYLCSCSASRRWASKVMFWCYCTYPLGMNSGFHPFSLSWSTGSCIPGSINRSDATE